MGRKLAMELWKYAINLRVYEISKSYTDPVSQLEPDVSLDITAPSSHNPKLKAQLSERVQFKLISIGNEYYIEFSIARGTLLDFLNSWVNAVNGHINISISPAAKKKFTEAEINKVIEDTLQEYNLKP